MKYINKFQTTEELTQAIGGGETFSIRALCSL